MKRVRLVYYYYTFTQINSHFVLIEIMLCERRQFIFHATQKRSIRNLVPLHNLINFRLHKLNEDSVCGRPRYKDLT